MSRYVDLEGVTWDGKPISSKIQEVQTKHGYLQGITIGWLWGDNVPHIDLEEHDKQIRADAINELKNKIVYHLNDYALQEAPIYQDEDDVANQRPVYLAIKNCINGVIEIAERLKEQK